MKHIIVGFICFLMNLINIHAQSCENKIHGSILDFHDGTPLAGATIYIKTQERYTTSDIDGNYAIKNICTGKLSLIISHVGCENKYLDIDVNGNMYKKINMEHHIEELEEVAIKTHGIKKHSLTAQETVLRSSVLAKYTSLSLGDALKEVPGVSSINTGNGIVKPVINGLHSSRVLILNNNVRLKDQEWGVDHAPSIDINGANQISVIKGSGALAYGGDAIGGVVVINPERAIRIDTLYGKTSTGYQSNGRGFNTSTSINKNYKSGWFAHALASYKKNGDFNAPDYSLTNTGLNSRGFTAKFGKNKFKSGFEVYYSYLANEIGILRSAHIGNSISLANAINAPRPIFTEDFSYKINPPKQETTHKLAKAYYYKRIKNFGKVDIQYDYQNNQRFEFDIRRGGRSVKPAIDLKLQTHSIILNAKKDNNLDRKYNLGLTARHQNNFANPETGVRRLIPDYNKYDFGSYITTVWKINDKLTADAGLRYDFSRIDAFKFYRTSFWNSRNYNIQFPNLVIETLRNQLLTNPVLDFHNLSSSLGFKYHFNDHNYVIGNYALSSRAPNPSELFSDGVHHSAARIEIGDLSFNSEQSNRISGSYGYTGTKLNFQVETYYNQIKDYIYLVPTQNGIRNLLRGPFPEWEYIQTNARFYGVDISTNYKITPRLQLKHKSSFIKGNDIKADLPLIDIPPFTTLNGITYTNTNWSNFTANINSEWVFRQNEFPDAFNYTIPVANGPGIDVDLSPPPSYHLIHFESKITLPLHKQSSLNIMFSVDNVFNTSYRNYLNRLRFFADDLGRNFRLQIQFNY